MCIRDRYIPIMNEKLLQYLWNFKIFNSFDFKDVEGNSLEILDFGKWNFDSGPDFLLGKIKTKDLVLAGNIELHIKSSDWIFHQHSGNAEFENLILHAVFIHDVEIPELKEKNIPTPVSYTHLEDLSSLDKYHCLLFVRFHWFGPRNWLGFQTKQKILQIIKYIFSFQNFLKIL